MKRSQNVKYFQQQIHHEALCCLGMMARYSSSYDVVHTLRSFNHLVLRDDP